MRFVVLSDIRTGMRLAQDLFDSQGNVLMYKDSELNESNIVNLVNYGYYGIYVTDDFSAEIKIEAPISEQLRRDGIEAVRNRRIDECIEIAKRIVDEIEISGIVSMDMTDTRNNDNFTFAHSVNVAVIACEIGYALKLPKQKMFELSVAAILHDIGKLEIPEEIVDKPGRLTGEEYRIMKSHVKLSYEGIKHREDITEEAKLAVLHHHENYDGSGYPYGLEGDQVNLLAKIIHVADVYDALSSPRPYKSSYAPSEVVEYLMGGCGILFDQAVVEALLNYIPIYPKGMQVTLSNGRKGLVAENTFAHNLRPVIKLMDGKFLDLTESKNLSITITSIVHFRIAEVMESEAERQKMLDAGRDKQKVIIAGKDVNGMIELQKALLERYDIKLVYKGADIVTEILTGGKTDILIMDIDLSDSNGIEIAKKINELSNNKVPIMFVAERNDRETVLQCKKAGAAGYIVKPYQITFLKAEIKRILTGRSEIY